MITALLLTAAIGLLGAAAIAATLRELARDGYRRVPTDAARAARGETGA
jgi:hypothetical protein